MLFFNPVNHITPIENDWHYLKRINNFDGVECVEGNIYAKPEIDPIKVYEYMDALK